MTNPNPPLSLKEVIDRVTKAEVRNQEAEKRNRKQTVQHRSLQAKAIGSLKEGGKVKKTGIYKLHRGEQVATVKQAKKIAKKGGLATLLSGNE